MDIDEFLLLVKREHFDALAKHGEQADLTEAGWLAVLVEEVGELAQAILQGDVRAASTETVQVAAMAARCHHAARFAVSGLYRP